MVPQAMNQTDESQKQANAKKYKQEYSASLEFVIDIQNEPYFEELIEKAVNSTCEWSPKQIEYYTEFQFIISRSLKLLLLGTYQGDVM